MNSLFKDFIDKLDLIDDVVITSHKGIEYTGQVADLPYLVFKRIKDYRLMDVKKYTDSQTSEFKITIVVLKEDNHA